MLEIEVKARLKNKNKIIQNLKDLGCVFREVLSQHDVVYVEKAGGLKTYLGNKFFLRVRNINNSRTVLNIKTNGSNSLAKIEHEVEVSSKNEIENIINLLGLVAGSRSKKKRVTTKYKNFEICIDDVSGLGSFIEVERIVKKGNAGLIQEELFKFLLSIGVKEEDRIFDGYDILILKNNV